MHSVTQPCLVFAAHKANEHQLVFFFLKNEKRHKKNIFPEFMKWRLYELQLNEESEQNLYFVTRNSGFTLNFVHILIH